MLFRYATGQLGLGFKALLRPHTATPSTRFVNAAIRTQRQTRLSSTASTLTPPWQISDLSAREQRYYEEFGPDYVDQVSKQEQIRFRDAIRRRKRTAELAEQRFGEDWYSITKEAGRRFEEFQKSVRADFAERGEKIGDNPEARRKLKDERGAWYKNRHQKKRQLEDEVFEERRKQS